MGVFDDFTSGVTTGVKTFSYAFVFKGETGTN